MKKLINKQEIFPKLKKLVEEGKLTQEEIAEKLGISRRSVYSLIKEFGLKYKSSVVHIRWEDHKEKLTKKIEEGLNYDELSEYLDINKNSVICYISSTRSGLRELYRKYHPIENTKTGGQDSEIIDREVLGDHSKKKYDCISLYLGKSVLTKSEFHKTYTEIFTDRNYIESILLRNDCDLNKTSRALHMGRRSLQYVLANLDIDVPSVLKTEIKKKIELLFIDMGLGINDIIEKLGLANSTVRRYLIEFFPTEYQDYLELSDGKSWGERCIEEYLKRNNIEYSDQAYYKDVAPKYRNYIKIDFELNYKGIRIWIEYQGGQHYNESVYFGINRVANHLDFLGQLNRDRCVRNYCKTKGIKFLELPYYLDTTTKINEYLDKFLLGEEDPAKFDLSELFNRIRSYGVEPTD